MRESDTEEQKEDANRKVKTSQYKDHLVKYIGTGLVEDEWFGMIYRGINGCKKYCNNEFIRGIAVKIALDKSNSHCET